MFFFKKKTADAAAPAPSATGTPDMSTIFGIKAQQSTDGDALDALLKGTTATTPKEQKSVLGAAPRAFLHKEETTHDFTRFKKGFFQFSVFCALVAFVYFQVQINPQLNIWQNSTVHTFEKEQNALLKTQTENNFYNIMRATFALNAFTTAAANYTSALTQSDSVAATSSQRAQAIQDAATEKTTLVQSLNTLKMLLPTQFASSDPSLPKTFLTEGDFKTALLAKIQTEITQIATGSDASANRDVLRLQTATTLVNSERLRSTLAGITVEEITDDQIDELSQIANNLNKNDFAIIAALKSGRLTWSSIIHDIEETTKTVDPLYGTSYQGKDVSAIIYNSYSLDSETGEITLSGSTRTDTSKTFTLISDLLDALEASDQFKNVQMRSFSKSEDEQYGYVANLSISLQLENTPAQ